MLPNPASAASKDHLLAAIEGREAAETCDGWTPGPLITRVGRAMLGEFDWNHKLVLYRLGGIAPLKQLSFSWLMKEVALK